MNSVLFKEWLRFFDQQMAGRKVALFIDNFLAHKSAVREINESSTPLQNTEIIWLSSNATSRFQLLD
jgi:hypothetical protein